MSWNKDDDAIMFIHDVTKKNLSRELNCIVDVVIWPKFVNASFSMREIIMNSIFTKIKIWPEKSLSLRGGLGSSSIIWDWH